MGIPPFVRSLIAVVFFAVGAIVSAWGHHLDPGSVVAGIGIAGAVIFAFVAIGQVGLSAAERRKGPSGHPDP